MWDPLGGYVAEGPTELGAPAAKQYNLSGGTLAQRFPVGVDHALTMITGH